MKSRFWSGKKRYFFLALFLSDLLAYSLCAVSVFSWMKVPLVNSPDPFYTRFFLFMMLILFLIYQNYGLYNDKRNLFDDKDFMKILNSAMISTVVLLVFIFIFIPAEKVLIKVILLTMVMTVFLTATMRYTLNGIIYLCRIKGYDIKKTIFFGKKDDPLLEKLADRRLGYEIIMVTDDPYVLERHVKMAEVIFIKMESIDERMLELMINNDSIHWKLVSSILNLVIEPVTFDEFRDYPLINISNNDASRGYLRIKRAFDAIFSGILILALSPLFLAVWVLIKLTMPGPVFFVQERLGKDLKPFPLIKFRTMVVGADEKKKKLKNEVTGLFKMSDDPRVTSLGKILRRTCIDELPQLFNVFMGDMSLVGPRPHLQSELVHFRGWRMARFRTKPGMTGMWQVNGRHELNFDKAILYDVYYVKHMSLFLDILIILQTIPAILITRGRY